MKIETKKKRHKEMWIIVSKMKPMIIEDAKDKAFKIMETIEAYSDMDNAMWKIHNYYKTWNEAKKHVGLVTKTYKKPENKYVNLSTV